MQIKKIVTAIICSSLAIGVANAGINVKINAPGRVTATDSCSLITGQWNGKGEVSANIFFTNVHCSYAGTGNISATGGNQYDMAIDLHATAVSPAGWDKACPAVTKTLKATCTNGNIAINDSDVVLNGSTDGETAAFRNGTVSILGITAKIDSIDLTR